MPPEAGAPPLAAGQAAHFRALESLYRHAAINRLFDSEIEIAEPGFTRICFEIGPETNHAAGAAHGTLYFKMMDDAAFYACNSMVSDRFLLTTAFTLVFTRPLKHGPVTRRGPLGQRQASRLRRRGAPGPARRRGSRARHGYVHALPYPVEQPRRL
jgi:acyl-coenzyme A thioesterase PaaI-like protein